MTENKVTGLLAAAIALGALTIGCAEDGTNDGDTLLYAPQGMTKADLIEAITKSAIPPTINPIGYIDGDSGVYYFDSGLVLDPGDVHDIDETGLAGPEKCDDECADQGEGHYPRGKAIDKVLGGRVLENEINKLSGEGDGGECSEDTCGKEDADLDPVSPGAASWMYLDHLVEGYAICWGECHDAACYEVCVYE
jgi:hypothetical protein